LVAVLSQVQEGEERVIAYFSRVLSKTEKNYCVTRRELLAIVDSVKFFHHYLYRRKFLIRTDHVSLKWLLSFKDLEGQLARWLERLQQYDFEVLFRKGRVHGNADGLSRRQCEMDGCSYCTKVEEKQANYQGKCIARVTMEVMNLKDWRKEQLADPSTASVLCAKEKEERPVRTEVENKDISVQIYWAYWEALVVKDGVLYRRWEAPNLKTSILQLVVPRSKIRQIMEEAHDSPSGEHFGVNKTLGKIRRRFYWATCKQDVEEWCKTCKICISRKGPSGKGKSPLQIYNVGIPFERVQIDILGPFPKTSSGNCYLLVIVDCFTKWVEAFPMKI